MLAEPASSLIVYSVILIAIYAAFWFGSGNLLKRAQNRGEKINYSKWCWYTAVFNVLFFGLSMRSPSSTSPERRM